MFHLEGVFTYTLYEVKGLAVETGRGDVTAQGKSLIPSQLGCLIYSTLAISDPILLPMTYFNTYCVLGVEHVNK